MINIYILSLGIFLILIGTIELAIPERSFVLWKKWIDTKYFPAHGFLLIAAGLPLTVYNGALSGIIFVLGIIIVLTGPFILIYPEKTRSAFNRIPGEIGQKNIKNIMRFDALARMTTGMMLILCYLIESGSVKNILEIIK